MTAEKLTGIILAGGQSSRMGREKALVEWRGKALYQWVLSAMQPLCKEVLISSNSNPNQFRGLPTIPDRFKQIGPLAGIESGLFHSTTPFCLFASCDTPYLSTEFFSYLLTRHGDFDITLAAHKGINEPMIGIYSKRIHPLVVERITAGDYKPPSLIRQTNWQEIMLEEEPNIFHSKLFQNMNRPEDLDS